MMKDKEMLQFAVAAQHVFKVNRHTTFFANTH